MNARNVQLGCSDSFLSYRIQMRNVDELLNVVILIISMQSGCTTGLENMRFINNIKLLLQYNFE